jgi:hypothetical protein
VSPALGQDVHFVSRTGKYEVPAKVNCTEATLNPEGVQAGFIPDLEAGEVHLTVFTPGSTGKSPRAGATDFQNVSRHEAQFGRSESMGGTYCEWGIAHDPHGAPGTFHDPMACPFGTDGGRP